MLRIEKTPVNVISKTILQFKAAKLPGEEELEEREKRRNLKKEL